MENVREKRRRKMTSSCVHLPAEILFIGWQKNWAGEKGREGSGGWGGERALMTTKRVTTTAHY
jgi:hypothetical protein